MINAISGFGDTAIRPKAAGGFDLRQLVQNGSSSSPPPLETAAVPIAVPAAAALTLKAIAIATMVGLGIGWNTLSEKEQRAVVGGIGQSIGGALDIIGKTGGNISALPRKTQEAMRQAAMDAMASTANVPSLAETIQAVETLPIVAECQPKKPEDLIGMCGLCTSSAYRQLRDKGIKRITQEPVANGAHYVLRINTKEGDYILDCSIGQFKGVNNPDSAWATENLLKGNGNNVVLMKREVYLKLLEKLPGRFY